MPTSKYNFHNLLISSSGSLPRLCSGCFCIVRAHLCTSRSNSRHRLSATSFPSGPFERRSRRRDNESCTHYKVNIAYVYNTLRSKNRSIIRTTSHRVVSERGGQRAVARRPLLLAANRFPVSRQRLILRFPVRRVWR